MEVKKIYDPIHGFVTITPLMQVFMDTDEFQRLREMKQLGLTTYVYPSATHTRFEHSLGVSHLAGQVMSQLQKKHPTLEISDRDIELCRVAGLLHDIGHGPFSHLYDDYVLSENEPHHELRGIKMIKRMVEKYTISLSASELNDILQMIDPDENNKHYWKYQIVANKIHTIDVDKMDYIKRDCYHIGINFGGEFQRIIEDCRVVMYSNVDTLRRYDKTVKTQLVLAWNEKSEYDIFSVFLARYRLHKQVLTHHTVKAYEYTILQVLNDYIDQRTKTTYTKNQMAQLTDMDIFIDIKSNPSYKDICTHLSQRKGYKRIKEMYTEYPGNETNQSLKQYRKITADYVIDCTPIGFSSSRTHPMYDIFYYSKLEPTIGYKKSQHDYRHFCIPHSHRELLWRLFVKFDETTPKPYQMKMLSRALKEFTELRQKFENNNPPDSSSSYSSQRLQSSSLQTLSQP